MCILSLILVSSSCKKEEVIPSKTELTSHPRILMSQEDEETLLELIQSDPIRENLHRAILKECNKILGKTPPERKMIGRRLLSTSREYLRRLFYLSYAYRMTEDDRFLAHAERHLLKAAAFSDWNPDHFLDVAEMTMGMAIGYDWLYHGLSPDSRKRIEEAILHKGIDPSYDSRYNRFLRSSNNWNQVCNAGMVYGALALESEHDNIRQTTIARAIETIPLAMKEYGPDGAYPEGYGYWGYGTTTNVMMLTALEHAGYSIAELINAPGFMQTPEFMMHMLAPSGASFNWGDNTHRGRLNPAMFWFASKRQDPSILWAEKGFLDTDDYTQFTRDRLLPALLLWSKDLSLAEMAEPRQTGWMGQGKNPVAMMRSSWSEPDAVYVGFKAGSPSVNHGHMDVGSFVLESQGVRWVSDLGQQNYESLESKGLKIFGKGQDAERWSVFRMNTFSHSTLIVNNEQQRVDGVANIERFSNDPDFSYAISDISMVYEGQLNKAMRGIGIKDQSYVILRDEVTTLDEVTSLRWNLLTMAEPEFGENEIILREGDRQLSIKILGPEDLVLKTWSTAPTNDYDAENPGSIMVGFEVELQPNQSETFEVVFIPEPAKTMAAPLGVSLEKW